MEVEEEFDDKLSNLPVKTKLLLAMMVADNRAVYTEICTIESSLESGKGR